ncbi:MAG: hypothetical protein HZB83_05595, partial [Deltaproteobacteria bacterium]|nr:hypothetical protein [Deltaproteobacteria bacterium]
METRIGYRLSVISYQTRFGLLYFTSAFAATNTFTVTLPANTEVTMQNPNSLLPFTVTNTGNGNSITDLTFKGNVAKYLISSATVPPPGWCVNDVAEDEIKFALIQPNGNCSNASTASAIATGASLVFNILINPVAAATDVAGDSLNEVKSSGMSFSGALPTWTRRSLEMTMIASPGSAGVGSEITLVMQITNRSTATQTLIASSPEPPASSNGQVTKTAG